MLLNTFFLYFPSRCAVHACVFIVSCLTHLFTTCIFNKHSVEKRISANVTKQFTMQTAFTVFFCLRSYQVARKLLASTYSWQDILKCHKLSRFMYASLIVFLEFVLWLTRMLNHKFWLYWNFFIQFFFVPVYAKQVRQNEIFHSFVCVKEEKLWKTCDVNIFLNLTFYAIWVKNRFWKIIIHLQKKKWKKKERDFQFFLSRFEKNF